MGRGFGGGGVGGGRDLHPRGNKYENPRLTCVYCICPKQYTGPVLTFCLYLKSVKIANFNNLVQNVSFGAADLILQQAESKCLRRSKIGLS